MDQDSWWVTFPVCVRSRVRSRVPGCIRVLRNTSLLPLKIDLRNSPPVKIQKQYECTCVCMIHCACMYATARVCTCTLEYKGLKSPFSRHRRLLQRYLHLLKIIVNFVSWNWNWHSINNMHWQKCRGIFLKLAHHIFQETTVHPVTLSFLLKQ